MEEPLPILAHREEIARALETHSVAIICGDTGSGKTTILPQICLSIGRKRIACTQPRRLAATTVAERVASMLSTPVGGLVGYTHRFAKVVSPETKIHFMTDGILLAHTREDPLLRAYDTIIIDEAHERSLNIDFLLGILHRLLEKRKDLKVIISSATLDSEMFARYFTGAAVVKVPGRMFPVECRYFGNDDLEDGDLPNEVIHALSTLPPNFDTLVFLPGEREIRETSDALQHSTLFRNDEIIPLLASLNQSEQKRAFTTSAKRRVILATNVAETSLTIPGVRAVIDSGLARISRYVYRNQTMRLQIEPISMASARQRMGRCGRVASGICIRLWDESENVKRDEYTLPEIHRTSLAGVILTMLYTGLGSIERFPFIDPPKPAMIREGLKTLVELGAIKHDELHEIRLTEIGRALARFPLDPRQARILVEASKLAILPSAAIIVAAMACDDPRRHSIEEREKANAAHAQWRSKESDFDSTLKLWRWFEENSKNLSQTRLRKLCKANYLSYQRMREWRDLASQITTLSKRLELDTTHDNGGAQSLVRAILSGLIGKIGHFDSEKHDYRGAFGTRFAIHPGSSLAKMRTPKEWVVCGELVDTNRLWARNAAPVEPEWIEHAAKHIAKHTYTNPSWDAKSGFVRVEEQISVYGLVIVSGRRRDFTRINPVLSREIFITSALIYGELENPPEIVKANLAIIRELKERAEEMRDTALFDMRKLQEHFENTIPQKIACVGDFKKWLYKASPSQLKVFALKKRDYLGDAGNSTGLFPKSISLGGVKIRLRYTHTPDRSDIDGITASVRASEAHALKLWRHEWLVPGALPDKIMWCLASLPSAIRRALPPITDAHAIIMPLLRPGEEPLDKALVSLLKSRFGLVVDESAFDWRKAPAHLKIRFEIVSDDDPKHVIIATRDVSEALVAAGDQDGFKISRKIYNEFPPEDIPERIIEKTGNWSTPRYPALSESGDGVEIKLFNDIDSALVAHNAAVAKLMLMRLTRGLKPDDAWLVAIREEAVKGKPVLRNRDAFECRLKECTLTIQNRRQMILSEMKMIDMEARALLFSAESLPSDIYDDIETQIAYLTFPGYIRLVAKENLQRYEKYFKALKLRIERAKSDYAKDRAKMARIAPWSEIWRKAATGETPVKSYAALDELRWLIEEFRIAVFAPEIKPSRGTSPEKLAATASLILRGAEAGSIK